jgi:phosphatidate cytidylyltransferase
VRTRSISAVGVVIVSIVPALFGGPVFAVVMTLLFLIGASEFLSLSKPIGRAPIAAGFLAVPAFAAAASFGHSDKAILGIAAFAVFAPLCLVLFRHDLSSSFVDWAVSAGGALYLGLPLYAVIATRRIDGSIDAHWLDRLADWLAFDWNAAPRGLAWFLTIIVITWLGDTGAYLIGRAAGKTPLIPTVSPKKTVEGLIGGLVCAAIAGAIANLVFGLGSPIWLGLGLGLLVAAIGVVGDLAESLFKRQAGVKDSGTLIPGHGGMLDRLDALLFTWTAGWFLVSLVDRWS